jgi:hypothetical protein
MLKGTTMAGSERSYAALLALAALATAASGGCSLPTFSPRCGSPGQTLDVYLNGAGCEAPEVFLFMTGGSETQAPQFDFQPGIVVVTVPDVPNGAYHLSLQCGAIGARSSFTVDGLFEVPCAGGSDAAAAASPWRR